MINDPGKHSVKDPGRAVSLRAGYRGFYSQTVVLSPAGPVRARGTMKALAEQIADLDGAEIYGRVVGVRG